MTDEKNPGPASATPVTTEQARAFLAALDLCPTAETREAFIAGALTRCRASAMPDALAVGDEVVIARPKHDMWIGTEGVVEELGPVIGVRLLGRSDHIRVEVMPDALDLLRKAPRPVEAAPTITTFANRYTRDGLVDVEHLANGIGLSAEQKRKVAGALDMARLSSPTASPHVTDEQHAALLEEHQTLFLRYIDLRATLAAIVERTGSAEDAMARSLRTMAEDALIAAGDPRSSDTLRMPGHVPGCICVQCEDLRDRARHGDPNLRPSEATTTPRCSVCGASRIVQNGRAGACSLVPGRDGTGGCPDPLRDVRIEEGQRPADAQPPLTITVPVSANEDTEITCLFCRRAKPCEYAIKLHRPGETALVGLHATCLEPFRALNPRRNEASPAVLEIARHIVETEIAYRRECYPGLSGARRQELEASRSYWIDQLEMALREQRRESASR